MLLNIEHRNIETSNLQHVTRATIKATPKVFSFFSDMTYSNKVLAILRELVANAIDAHTMAGYDGPVEVYLPSNEDPTLRGVDHGTGMSHDFMCSNFMAFTDGSTKSGSNQQIGGFGIGSKSPFAYTDQFMIRSVHDGIASIYTVFKDEEGIPSIGTLNQSPTDEGNGVEVIVPIKPQDFQEFRTTAQSALCYFEPRPTVDGVEVTAPEYSSKGNGWAVRKQAGRIGVIMGGVRYEVPDHTVAHDLARYGIDITLPIGTCAVALSRETLSMDTNTRAAIVTALNAVIEEITESFGTMFDHYPSLWEAKIALANEVQGNWARSGFVTRHAKYMGEPLQVNSVFDGYCWKIQQKSSRSVNIPPAKWEHRVHFNPREIYGVIVDDADKRNMARLRYKFTNEYGNGKKFLVVKNASDLEKLGNPPREIVYFTGQMAVPPAAERATYAPTTKFYDFYGNEIPNLDGRVCKVEMIAFKKPSGLIFGNLINANEVVFVNKKDWGAVKHLPSFQDLHEKRKEAYVAEHGAFLAEYTAVRHDQHLKPIFDWLAHAREAIGELTPAQKSRPLGKIISLYDRHKTPSFRVFLGFVEPKLPPRLSPEALVTAIPWQIQYLMEQRYDDRAYKLIKELM